MDELTLDYYSAAAAELAELYSAPQPEMDGFIRRAFAEGMRILDVGAGVGRDVDLLVGMGCDAYGVEPCDELRLAGLKRHPELAGRIEPGGLPDLGQPFGGKFDAVLCSGVLTHVPRESLPDAAVALRNVLKTDGRLLLSIPTERPDLGESHRDEHGRLFTPLPLNDLESLFERAGFRLAGVWWPTASPGQKAASWYALLFEVDDSGRPRPHDRVWCCDDVILGASEEPALS